MKHIAILLAGCMAIPGVFAAQTEGAGRSFTFTKEFPGSVPPYYSITVRDTGEALYKTEPDDERPIEFLLGSHVTSEVFSLAGKLGQVGGGSLESRRRVANMGKKTIEYQNGADPFTASFNHTEVPEALALLEIFERISATQQHAIRLEYLRQFDRLGIVKALLQLEIDLDNGRLLGTEQLAPMLERIRNDRAIVQLAKARATQILGKIQSETSQSPSH
jgi:hypothetical protein